MATQALRNRLEELERDRQAVLDADLQAQRDREARERQAEAVTRAHRQAIDEAGRYGPGDDSLDAPGSPDAADLPDLAELAKLAAAPGVPDSVRAGLARGDRIAAAVARFHITRYGSLGEVLGDVNLSNDAGAVEAGGRIYQPVDQPAAANQIVGSAALTTVTGGAGLRHMQVLAMTADIAELDPRFRPAERERMEEVRNDLQRMIAQGKITPDEAQRAEALAVNAAQNGQAVSATQAVRLDRAQQQTAQALTSAAQGHPGRAAAELLGL